MFVYLREAFGRLPAFLFGWAALTIVRASALGAIATVFAEYLLRLLGSSSGSVPYVAAASIFLVAIFNTVGINMGVKDTATPPWLADSPGAIDVEKLDEMCRPAGIKAAFAGDWHADLLRFS